MSEQYQIRNLAELDQLTLKIAGTLHSRQIILLEGELGAGKTEFVRSLLKALGSQEVTSPSFSIHNHYDTASVSVEHLDLYRLESEADLESTGFWDLFSQSEGLILIEWAERVDLQLLPRTWQKLRLRIKTEMRPALDPLQQSETLRHFTFEKLS
jgi:tRNA threonylcarbamoyladenosine biosynthesis protein TsaE